MSMCMSMSTSLVVFKCRVMLQEIVEMHKSDLSSIIYTVVTAALLLGICYF